MDEKQGCGTCSMCCKLMGVNDGDVSTPAGEWCSNCAPGNGGCTRYATRPQACQDFACVWLQSQDRDDFRERLPLALRPDNSRVVIVASARADTLFLHVDPGTPEAWRDDAVRHFTGRCVRGGINLGVSVNGKLVKAITRDGIFDIPPQEPA